MFASARHHALRCRPSAWRWLVFPLAGAAVCCSAAFSHGDEPAEGTADSAGDRAARAEQLEFFEREVRPLLANRCYECHGPETQEAGLRLDTKAGIAAGAETGEVFVAGQPDKSRLIQVVRYDGDVQMPPDGKLTDAEIAALSHWIELGAPLPDESPTDRPPADSEGATVTTDDYAAIRAAHWAFQPIVRHELPAVDNEEWVRGPIDRFVLARLEAAGLEPSPPAAPPALLRRASFGLIGLPPGAAEIERFLADDSPDAFARLVDRLLDSPHYGETWARHWLDVARYADTKGYVFTAEPRYPYAYTYRTYVIEALNCDLPYDRFVLEQLAADKIVDEADPRPLAALGFLTLGRRFDNNTHDVIDDRIDVVTRGLLGLTVTCARCHDHKYDPVPIADYYSLYGVLASSVEPEEQPLIASPAESEAYAEYMRQLNERQTVLDRAVDGHLAHVQDQLRRNVTDYLVRVVSGPNEAVLETDPFVSLSPDEIKPGAVRRWRRFLGGKVDANHPVFGPWAALAALPEDRFADEAAAYLDHLAQAGGNGGNGEDGDDGDDGTAAVNRLVREALIEKRPTSMIEVAHCYGQLLSETYRQWQDLIEAHAAATAEGEAGDPPSGLPDAAAEELRQILVGDDMPTTVSRDRLDDYVDRAAFEELRKLRGEVETLKAGSPDAPARAMALVDAATPVEPHVFLRGNPHRHGDRVPRRFLTALAGDEPPPFQDGSGRLELARAIVDPANPLTPRVIVNRVWQHHFGHGLVRTSSDFGTRGDPPTHPELLDYLASEFMAHGWSLKWLHREIMNSATYRQSSTWRAEAAEVDAENRLLWRMNRRRLEFEALRDAMLSAAGRLDTTVGGRSVDLFSEPFTTRRSVYGFIDRQDLPGVLRVFDFASPDASTPQRIRTIVPQQALFLLNSPFVIEQARHVAGRAVAEASDDQPMGIATLYTLVLGRPPDEQEAALAARFLDQPPDEANENEEINDEADASPPVLSPWERLAQALLLTNEFVYVD